MIRTLATVLTATALWVAAAAMAQTRVTEAAYLPDTVASLPTLGRLTGRGNTANVEVVLRAKPDLIVDLGHVRDARRARRAANGHSLSAVRRFARGNASTAPRSGARRRRIRGGRNARTRRREAASRGDGARRPRQRALGAPDVIIASDPAFASAVKTLPGWRDVPAVRAGRIYVPPDLPFGWFDAPPSLNRLLGVQWLVRILHPRLFPEPLGPRVKAFHTLYYHRSPSDAQVRALLDAADVAP